MAGPTANIARAAAAQRFYNRGSGRMETAAQMRAYHPSTTHPVPAGHSVSRTTSTVTRTAPFNPATTADWTRLNGSQLREYAEYLVNKDVAASRLPFLAANRELAAEQQNTSRQYGQVAQNTQTLLKGIATGAGEQAKTDQNRLAEQVAKSKQETSDAFTKLQGYQSPELQQQRAAAEARQAASGAAATQGQQTRQEAESNYLTNLQAAAGQRAQERQGDIASRFGKEEEANRTKEQALAAQGPAKAQELWQKLVGQKTALQEARAKLGIQVERNEITRENDVTKNRTAARNAGTAERRAATGEFSAKANAEYKRASLAQKEKLDAANIKNKEGALAVKVREWERKNGPGKVPSTVREKSMKELGTALNAFESGPNVIGKHGKPAGKNYTVIRNNLGRGFRVVEMNGKEKTVKSAAITISDPVILNAAEQIFRYHYVNAATKKALAEKGIPAEGLSTLLRAGHPGY